MRYLIITCLLTFSLLAKSYDFYEYKYIYAVNEKFKKSGHISFDKNKTIITYDEPNYRQIVSNGKEITITTKSNKVYKLKGKALYYTMFFINIMTSLDNIEEIKTNKDFDVKKEKNIYYLNFKGEFEEQIPKAEVKVKNKKVTSFKLYMNNNDTLEIVKK